MYLVVRRWIAIQVVPVPLVPENMGRAKVARTIFVPFIRGLVGLLHTLVRFKNSQLIYILTCGRKDPRSAAVVVQHPFFISGGEIQIPR